MHQHPLVQIVGVERPTVHHLGTVDVRELERLVFGKSAANLVSCSVTGTASLQNKRNSKRTTSNPFCVGNVRIEHTLRAYGGLPATGGSGSLIGIGGSLTAPPTGSPGAVARSRLPHNVACGFPALRSSEIGSQHSDSLQLPIG